jgi:hypothetical protein
MKTKRMCGRVRVNTRKPRGYAITPTRLMKPNRAGDAGRNIEGKVAPASRALVVRAISSSMNDCLPFLFHKSTHLFLNPHQLAIKAAAESAGLSRQDLYEGIAYALVYPIAT